MRPAPVGVNEQSLTPSEYLALGLAAGDGPQRRGSYISIPLAGAADDLDNTRTTWLITATGTGSDGSGSVAAGPGGEHDLSSVILSAILNSGIDSPGSVELMKYEKTLEEIIDLSGATTLLLVAHRLNDDAKTGGGVDFWNGGAEGNFDTIRIRIGTDASNFWQFESIAEAILRKVKTSDDKVNRGALSVFRLRFDQADTATGTPDWSAVKYVSIHIDGVKSASTNPLIETLTEVLEIGSMLALLPEGFEARPKAGFLFTEVDLPLTATFQELDMDYIPRRFEVLHDGDPTTSPIELSWDGGSTVGAKLLPGESRPFDYDISKFRIRHDGSGGVPDYRVITE